MPYQVCRMVAEQSVIQVPHCLEKRIPVTYTCNVPRLVCYRVPLDACGQPIAAVSPGAAPATVMAPPAIGMAPPAMADRRRRADEVRRRRQRQKPQGANASQAPGVQVEAETPPRGRPAPGRWWGRETTVRKQASDGGAPANKAAAAGTGGLSVQVALTAYVRVWSDGRPSFAPNGRVRQVLVPICRRTLFNDAIVGNSSPNGRMGGATRCGLSRYLFRVMLEN